MEGTVDQSDSSKFRVNRDLIDSIEKKDQALELQELDVTVYDHCTLEWGILEQVKDALDEEEDKNSEEEEGEIKDEVALQTAQDKLGLSPSLSKKCSRRADASSSSDSSSFLERYLKQQSEFASKRNIEKKRQAFSSTISSQVKQEETKQPTDQLEPKASSVAKSSPVKRKKNTRPSLTKSKRQKSLSVEDAEERQVNGSSGSEYNPIDDEDYSSNDEVSAGKDIKKKTLMEKRTTGEEDEGDSHWESSEDERFIHKKSKKELDDGDLDIFMKRTKSLTKINRDDSVSIDVQFRVPKYIWDKLFSYQQEGVRWMWKLHSECYGGILGDEMGLGKTIQLIAFLAGLHFSQEKDLESNCHGLGASLIVCPTTIMHQWVREFHTWYPHIRVAILHESGTFSGKNRKQLIKSISSKTKGILVTSYSGLIQNKDAMLAVPWHYIVLDEGHKIRNPEAQVTSVVKSFDTNRKIILSGTPMQNNLKELWSLFDFIVPGKLGSLNIFTASFVTPIMQGGYVNASKTQVLTAFKCASALRDTIKPYLLRRSKTEVNLHLPAKKEQVLFCKLTDDQREAYLGFLRSLDLDYIQNNKGRLFGALVILRKICNHPDIYTSDFHDRFVLRDSMFGPEKGSEDDYGFWRRSGKMIVLVNLLKHWEKIGGQKVVLFTQGKKMMVVLENFVKRSGYKYLKLDGSVSTAARQPLIDKFNIDDSYFIMLLTTRVGGLGVNLTGANKVVIFDPDWNPATDAQARERAWRIGQSKDVCIYRLLTTGTIEEKIYHRQIFKEFLSNKILKDAKQRRFFKANDLMELFTLNETVKGGTSETAAIFAGTGSEIKYDRRAAAKFSLKKCPDMPKIIFPEAKLEEMKRIAQEMSRRVVSLAANKGKIVSQSSQAADTNSSQTPSEPMEDIYGPDGRLNPKLLESIHKNYVQSDVSCNDTTNSNENNVENSGSCDASDEQSFPVDTGNFASLEVKTSSGPVFVQDSQHKLISGLTSGLQVTNSQKTETVGYNNNDPSVSKIKHSETKKKTEDNLLSSDKKMKKEGKTKYKNKSMRKDKSRAKCKKKLTEFVKFEGEVVPHLVKCRPVKKKKKEQQDEHMFKNHDDYILHKLLKKSGVDTAMKHDTIMEDGPSDYAIVEEEASRVAQDAVKAIQQSYSQTLTGRNQVQMENPVVREIMKRLRERNLQGVGGGGPQAKALLTNLIIHLNSMGGTSSTNQLVETFRDKVDEGKSPVFKKLLSSIATFYRAPDSKGYWTLKDEFKSLAL